MANKRAQKPEEKEWLTLVRKAEDGDPTALQQVRTRFDELPAAWDLYSLSGRLQFALVQGACGDNAVFRAGLEREVQRLRQELSGPNPTPIERLCVERIIASWLEASYSGCKASENCRPGASFQSVEFYDRRHDRAERRLLVAIKTLATVRRLAVPNIQVNLAAPGAQQMNVQGP